MMKPIDFYAKSIAVLTQPIASIGWSKNKPIAPIDNLLTWWRAIGLCAQVLGYIYIYIIYIYLLTYCTYLHPRTRKTRVFTRTRTRERNRFMDSPKKHYRHCAGRPLNFLEKENKK